MTHGGLKTTVKTATSEGNDVVGVRIRWADELADPRMDPLVCSRRETHASEGEMTTMLSPRRVVLVPVVHMLGYRLTRPFDAQVMTGFELVTRT
jgi:hypothetical protein